MTLTYNGDNRRFVVEEWLPELDSPEDVRQVIRWAYGYDGSDRSYEMESDGSSIVPDFSMNGIIKEPVGVGHDFLNRVMNHITPDGHKWTMKETCDWYRSGMKVYNYGPIRRWFRWTGLMLSANIPFIGWWK